MNRHPFLLAALALSGLLPSHPSPAQGNPPPRLLLQAMDTDNDGTLSPGEIEHASASLLTLDRDHDGQLTPDEYLPEHPEAQQAQLNDTLARLMAMDRNGDGVLTPDELPGRMQTLFQRGDTNHDGKLTPAEIRAMLQQQSALQGRPVGTNGADGISRTDPLINIIDVDHNGTLSAAELASASGALKALDTDADGTLQPIEMRVRQQTPAERAAHILDDEDSAKTGTLAKAQLPNRLQAQFNAIDTNHDGKVNLEELTTYFATQTNPAANNAPRNDAPAAPQLPPASQQNATPAQP